MNNLRFMRRILVTNIRKRYSPKELSDEKLISIVHALLGRSILTKYLEERKDKNGESVFPNGFFSQFKDGAATYSDVLDDKAATYGLFKELTNHFNGDMFPLVPQEYDVITTDELTELKHFILGTTDFENAAYISTVVDESRIDEYAYDLYQLKDYEREFIENAVSNIYDYFYVKGNSAALSPLTNETAKRYCDVLTDILQNSLGSLENIGTILYRGNSPLVAIQILFESTSAHVINRADELDVLLSQLDRLLLDERSGSMAVKRNVRVYKKDSVYIIKPNQSRYWSYSNACNDADEIYADIMRAWRENNERY